MHKRILGLWAGLLLLVVALMIAGRGCSARVIAYSARTSNNADIHLADLTRGLTLQLTNHIGNDINPTWGPDGQRLAFASDRAREGVFALYVLDLLTREVRRVVPGESAVQPTWSPDGAWIAYIDNGGTAQSGRFLVYLVRPDGSERHLLTDHAYDTLTPAWSPDGTQVVFRTTSPMTVDALRRVDVASGDITRLEGTANASFPTYVSEDTVLFSRGQMLYQWQAGAAVRLAMEGIQANVHDGQIVFVGTDLQINYGPFDGDWQRTRLSGLNPVWRP